MRRRLFNLLAVLSLVLCVATAALWVRSYWYGDMTYHAWSSGHWYLDSWRGRLTWCDSNRPGGSTSWWYARKLTDREQDGSAFLRSWLGRRGFTYLTEAYPPWDRDRWPGQPVLPPIIRDRYVRVPHWLVAGLLVVVPVARLMPLLRARRRVRIGLCPSCGYDLRASPERCPECGTVATTGTIT